MIMIVKHLTRIKQNCKVIEVMIMTVCVCLSVTSTGKAAVSNVEKSLLCANVLTTNGTAKEVTLTAGLKA